MGKDRRLRPSPFAGLLGLVSTAFFLLFLFSLYFASAGYQIALIQDQLLAQAQKQGVKDLANDPRFKQILSSQDTATKLLVASATSLEDGTEEGTLEAAFTNLETRKASIARDKRSAAMVDEILADYRAWQTARKAAAEIGAKSSGSASEREKILADYKLLVEDVEAVFQSSPPGEAGPAEGQAAVDLDPEDPFNLYTSGVLAGIPRIRGLSDGLEEAEIASHLRQPVDLTEPPSVKVERIKKSMSEIALRYEQLAESAEANEQLLEKSAAEAAALKTKLRSNLFKLIAFAQRTGLDNGALKVYEGISRLAA